MNKGGKHYIVIPTLTDISAASDNYAASTSVFCPYKVIGSHNGGKEPVQSEGGKVFAEGFFQEVMGIVPSKIHFYHTGSTTLLTEDNIATWIDKIRYNYLEDGHKVISIIYNQNAFSNNKLYEIEFKVLFEDGDYHSVKQPIIHSMCLDEDSGIVLNTDEIFDAETAGSSVSSPGKHHERRGTLKISNTSSNSKVMSFYTCAYRDRKFDNEGVATASNRDYFHMAYYNLPLLQYTTNDATSVTANNGEDYLIGTRGASYEFRQLGINTDYSYESAQGISGGTLGHSANVAADEISLLRHLILVPDQPSSSQNRYLENGNRSIDFFNTICEGINAGGTTLPDADQLIFDPNFPLLSSSAGQNNLYGGKKGFAGSINGNSYPATNTEVNAFYLPSSPSARRNEDTSRRTDGIIYAIRKADNTAFSNTVTDNGYDTDDDELKFIAIKLLEANIAQTPPNGGASSVSPYASMTSWSPPNVASSYNAGNLILTNLMSPQDAISNFILGRHSFYLSRPFNANNVNVEQSTYQASLTAALFRKDKHPSFTHVNNSSLAAGHTTSGIQIAKEDVNNQRFITAVPYHVYVDSFQNIKSNTISYSSGQSTPSVAFSTSSLASLRLLTGDSAYGNYSISVNDDQPSATTAVKVREFTLQHSQHPNLYTEYVATTGPGAEIENRYINNTNSVYRPSLDKNSVKYSASNVLEPFLSGQNTQTFQTFGPNQTFTNTYNTYQLNDDLFLLPHAEIKGIITNDGYLVTASADNRKTYLRGCVDMKRGRTLEESNYQLDLLITPGLSVGIELTELQFTAKYDAGISNISPSFLFNFAEGMTDAPNCGCGGVATDVEWENSDNENVDTNALDIFGIKYTPGRNIIDNSLFPINTDEFSPGTSVTADDGSSDTDGSHPLTLTINMDNDQPTALDRPLVDVNLSSFQWDETFTPVSKLQIAQREGEADIQVGTEIALGANGGLEFSPQTFEFVAVGAELVRDGGVDPDILGCTDPLALNYNPEATLDNGECIYCDEDDPLNSGFGEFLSAGIGFGGVTISPQPAINNGNAPFDLSNFISQIDWWGGQIGNAHNHWSYALNAAVAADGSVAVPYGDAFGDTANPYTEFKLEFNFTPYDSSNYPGDSLQTLFNNLIADGSFSASAFSLTFYDIEKWAGGNSDYIDLYTVEQFNALLTEGASTPSIGDMVNQGTATAAKFASYNLEDNPSGFIPNVTDPLTDGFGQTFLQAGKQYLVVLNISMTDMFSAYIDPNSGKPISCGVELRVPYNFWVTFCACDLPNAPNFIGNTIDDYAWSGTSTFPAGYSYYDQCQTSAQPRVKRSNDAEAAGYCLPVPDPFNCDNFIDACVQTVTADCIPLNNGTGQQSFVGALTVDVFGAFTGADNADQYAFVFGDELFQFELWLIEGIWDGTTPAPEEGMYYSFQSLDDYLAQGFNPSSSGGLNLTFTPLEAGTYTVVINQLSAFSFQEDYYSGELVPCPMTSLDPVTVGLADGTECPDLVVGCTDPDASNFNEEADVDDGSCEYIDCDDLYLSGKITEVTAVNTVINCVNEVLDAESDTTANVLVDTGVGSLTVTSFTDDITGGGDTGTIAGTFVMGYCQIFDGNAGAAITNLLDLFGSSQNDQITNTSRTETIFISAGGVNIGGFLGFNQPAGTPILTTGAILDAGQYVIMLIPDFSIVQDQDCTSVLVENFDSVFITGVGATFNYVDCPTPCNDQTNPEDCGDQIGDCTDPNAENYNPDATFDIGNCDFADQDECDQNPDAEGCEDCTDALASGLTGFRDCDQFNDTTEGCCDPLACNYDSTVDVCLQSRCEYCCDGTEDCVDDPGPDECEDENGNILPDCVQPECPDPANPDCQEPPVDPCPNGDCGGPPEAECVILGNCPEGGTGDDEDDAVIIDDPIIEEVTCAPTGLGNYSTFDDVRLAAMTCSANEGSKLLFKIRSGVKTDRTDLIKLELINYLFNNAINEPCMANCDNTDDQKAIAKGIKKPSCNERWKSGGFEVWTPTSTYGRGVTVAVIRYSAGKLKRRFYTSTAPVGSGDVPPNVSIANTNVSKWTPCVTVRGKSSNNPGEPAYINKLYEFMAKFCEQCSVYQTTPGLGQGTSAERDPKEAPGPSGLVDENGNEIKLF
tara:strand:+ start:3738 stop:10118 length:6381 start_codon:yes stop_codon:yes gene_type:complete